MQAVMLAMERSQRKVWRRRVDLTDTCPAQAPSLTAMGLRTRRCTQGGTSAQATAVKTILGLRTSCGTLLLVLLAGQWQQAAAQVTVDSFQAYPLRNAQAAEVEG